MNPIAISHSVVSFILMVLGFFAWRLTSSRSIAFNAVFGSVSLLLAAYMAQTAKEPELVVIIPFIVFSLYAGRAIGLGYRSRQEKELLQPAVILGVGSIFSLGAAIAAYLAR